jgi:hypothetical protein
VSDTEWARRWRALYQMNATACQPGVPIWTDTGLQRTAFPQTEDWKVGKLRPTLICARIDT